MIKRINHNNVSSLHHSLLSPHPMINPLPPLPLQSPSPPITPFQNKHLKPRTKNGGGGGGVWGGGQVSVLNINGKDEAKNRDKTCPKCIKIVGAKATQFIYYCVRLYNSVRQ